MTTTFASCLAKQRELINFFTIYPTVNEKYVKLIELGRSLAPFQDEWRNPSNLVPGCQSQVFIHSTLQNGKMVFYSASEALISAGLVALLFAVYNEEPPEAILGCYPSFIEELGLNRVLSPGRSHGLLSIYLRMKQETIKFLIVNK